MKILLTNDDGINAPGLAALCRAVGRSHTVYVVAPDRNKSACGHSLTMSVPIIHKSAKLEGSYAAYSVSGTPADCVKYAILELFGHNYFDLVLAGINSGPNLGTDIMYSGTASAAFEGAYMGLKAIATSYCDWNATGKDFVAPAKFVADNLDALVPMVSQGGILNINIPHSPKGYKITSIGINQYNDRYEGDDSGKMLVGDMVPHKDNIEDCDVVWISKGYTTISPATMDRNDYRALEVLRDTKLRF